MNVYHKPVMLKQCIEALQIKPDGIYVDATFGGGGHSEEILKHLRTGRLIAFDLFDRMGGYTSAETARAAAQLQLLAMPRAKRSRKHEKLPRR